MTLIYEEMLRNTAVRYWAVHYRRAGGQGEKTQALVTRCDPRATGIFVGLCFLVVLVLYLVQKKMVAMASEFYYFRHQIFRDRKPFVMLFVI